MKTAGDLVHRALALLEVAAAGKAPAAEDVALVAGHLDGVLADPAERGVYWLAERDEIPDGAFHHLARLLAHEAAPDFGVAGTEAQALRAERMLRAQTATPDAGEPIRFRDF